MSSFLQKEQISAEKKEYEEFRSKWFNSELGSEDISKSVNKIFKLVENIYSASFEIFSSKKGLNPIMTDENTYDIQNDDFGCHIKIVNFNLFQLPRKITSDIFLEIFLYETKHNPTGFGGYVREQIKRICLLPDINTKRQLVWKDFNYESKIYTEQQIGEFYFELLISQIDSN